MAYIGKSPTVGNFVKLDALTASATASYTMQVDSVNFNPESVNHMMVSLNGVIQSPTTSYTISGSTITFASTLASSDSIDFIMVYGNVLDIGTPSDATVTNAKTNFVSTSSSAGLQIKGDGTTDGTLQLNCSQNSHGIKLKSPPHSASASYTLTFPNDDGDADQVLKTNGSGVLDWTTPSSGSFAKLSTVDISSGDSLVAFNSSIITTTYKQYLFMFTNLRPTGDNTYFKMQESTNNGGGFLANDADSFISINNTSWSSTENLNHSVTNNTDIQLTQDNIGNGTLEGMSGQMFFSRDGANASKGNWELVSTNNGHVYHQHGASYRDDAGTTNYVRFQMQGTTFISGRITCYGIVT